MIKPQHIVSLAATVSIFENRTRWLKNGRDFQNLQKYKGFWEKVETAEIYPTQLGPSIFFKDA